MKLSTLDDQAVGDNQKSRRWWSGLIIYRTVFSEEKFKFAIRFSVASVSVKDSNDMGFLFVFVCLFLLLLLFFGASGLTFAPYLNEECNYQSC